MGWFIAPEGNRRKFRCNRLICLTGIVALAITPGTASSQDSAKVTAPARNQQQAANTPLPAAKLTKGLDSAAIFIENRGQFDPRVKFQAKIGGKTAWLTGEGIIFDVTRLAAHGSATSKTRTLPGAGAPPRREVGRPPFASAIPAAALQTLDRLVFAEDFVEKDCCSRIEGRGLQPGAYNYFLGADGSKWGTNAHLFSEVIYRDVWPGVDLRVYGNGSDLEQEFIVQPGGDLKKVKVSYRGIDKLEIGEDGSLEISTAFGLLRETKPQLFQEIDGERESVQGRYRLTTRTSYTFDVHPPNSLYTLVIDPTLLFSTFVGGSGQGIAGESGVASDSFGNAYIAGTTLTGTYPTTTGAFQVGCPSSNCSNIYTPFVSKFDPLGRLLYSTFLGSSTGGDTASALAVDSSGNAYLTGNAQSGYPTTSTAYPNACPGVFMTELNPSGATLLYSTCIGTSYGTGASGIAVGNNGNIYLTGYTSDAVNFPLTSGALQKTLNATPDAFVSVIDPTLAGAQSLVYSTYLGGDSVYTGGDGGFGNWGYAIAVDSFGSAYVTGITYAMNFPVTSYAFQSANHEGVTCNNGLTNPITCGTGFVSKINPNISGPSGLIYSTYLGGSVGGYPSNQAALDAGTAIAVDSSGNAFVGGSTLAGDFPVTAGALQTTGNNHLNCFVTKLNAGGSSLVYSTFVGQSSTNQNCQVRGIALDISGNAYVAGSISPGTFPTTSNAFQTTFQGGNTDGFLSELNSAGSALVYSSFLGGIGSDGANGVAIDAVGDVFVAGATASVNFPTTLGAYQTAIPTGSPCNSGNVGFCYSTFLTKFPLGSPGGLMITGILPNMGGNVGAVSTEIVGSGFHAGATATLNCGQPLTGQNTTAGTHGRLLNAMFDLRSATPGRCDLVVTNPDGTSATLAQAFTVLSGGSPSIALDVIGLDRMGLGISEPYYIVVSNFGDVDAYDLFLNISVPIIISYDLGCMKPSPADVAILWLGSSWCQMPVGYQSASNTNIPFWVNAVPSHGQFGQPITLAVNSPPGPPHTSFTAMNVELTGYNSTFSRAGDPAQIATSPVDLSIIQAAAATFGGSGGAIGVAANARVSTPVSSGTPATQMQANLTNDVRSTINWCTDDTAHEILCGVPFKVAGYLGELAGALGAYTGAEVEAAMIYARTVLNGYIDLQNRDIQIADNVEYLAPGDPNRLAGPNGIGGAQWVARSHRLNYAVFFENEPSASAPAQSVVVSNPLDPSIDLSSVSLTAINIAGIQVPIPKTFMPAAGLDEISTSIDLRPSQDLLVNVDAKLDPTTRVLTWDFTSIDPNTGSPPSDPLVGFLPPSANGSVLFGATLLPGTTTGTQISSQGSVVFNSNPAINTNIWINTTDNTPPVSHVLTLPAFSGCSTFRVSWTGSDVGSGLQRFAVFASDTGGPYTPWLSNTTAGSGVYIGQLGHTYSFYAIATDLSGNIEGGKTTPEASTSVAAVNACGPPSLAGQVSNVVQSGTTVTATLALTNAGFTAAQNININQIDLKTLGGSGTVTLTSPSLPLAAGPLAIGATTTVPLTFTSPTSVTRFSLTEGGTVRDAAGNGYSFSIAQTIIP
jgi:Beta-propeller repeat